MIALVLSLLFSSPAQAAPCTVITGGTLQLPSGAVEGALVLDGERIAALGEAPPGLTLSEGGATWKGASCARIDAAGRVVTPGLVEPASRIGIEEVGLEEQTVDADAGSEDPVRAAMRVADAYNPRSSVIPVTRIEGVTSTVVVPSGGRVSGQAAWADLAGATQADAIASRSVAVVANLGGSSRAESLLELRELLADARFHGRNRAAWEQNRTRDLAASGPDLEALQPVLSGKVPLLIGADRVADIEAVLRLATDEKIRVVILGGAEAWLLADDLAAARVPVVLDPYVYGPGGFDQLQGRPDNAVLLHAAGVPIALTSGQTHNARTLPQVAGNAVRGGLSHEAALHAVTTGPADIFGMSDRGRLAEGAVATVVVWSGDPLEIGSRVEHLWIEGRPIALESRQTKLLERYRELPGVVPLAE